jgi:hypothetical protein
VVAVLIVAEARVVHIAVVAAHTVAAAVRVAHIVAVVPIAVEAVARAVAEAVDKGQRSCRPLAIGYRDNDNEDENSQQFKIKVQYEM